jgi:hypothetical protein
MPAMNTTLIASIVISLCVGGAVGAGVTRIVFQQPVCVAAPAQAPNSFNVAPLTDPGKTYK